MVICMVAIVFNVDDLMRYAASIILLFCFPCVCDLLVDYCLAIFLGKVDERRHVTALI